MRDQLSVSAVIPRLPDAGHSDEQIRRCMRQLEMQSRIREVICVNVGVAGKNDEVVFAGFPRVQQISVPKASGYGLACNAGARIAKGDVLLFLNDDAALETEHDRIILSWFQSPRVAAVQPKVLAEVEPRRFEYAGAAGGFLDVLGFPLARGRVLSAIEEDHGQYDTPVEVFWGAGCALFVRMDAFWEVGGFDEDFYMYMEEIDLCWRLRLKGYSILADPSAIAYHKGSVTTIATKLNRLHYNHRNNWAMLIKNYDLLSLVRCLLLRLPIEVGAVCQALIQRQWATLTDLASSYRWLVVNLVPLIRKRALVQDKRTAGADAVRRVMLADSVVYGWFLRGRRRYSDYPDACRLESEMQVKRADFGVVAER